MAVVFDTNIIIDYEKGIPAAGRLIASTTDRFISRITWMEVLCFVDQNDAEIYEKAMSMLAMFEIIEVDEAVLKLAAQVFHERSKAKKAIDPVAKVRHADCIIYATAMLLQVKLVTRNAKDFKPVAALGSLNIPVEIPY